MDKCLLILLMLSLASADTCTTKVASVELSLSTLESQWWGLEDVFFDGDNLKFTLSDESNFKLVQPLSEGGSAAYAQKVKLVDVVPLTSNGRWMNSFAMLDSSYNVLWAQGEALSALHAPAFTTVTPVKNSTVQKCFGLDYVSPTQVVVDCFDPVTHSNYMNLVSAAESVEFAVSNDYKYVTVTDRIIKVHRVQSLLEEVVYIYRAVPTYATTTGFAGKSVIEVFVMDGSTVKAFSTLDATTLAILTGVSSFDLVEFEVQSNGIIYVLDQNGWVHRLTLTADAQWHSQGSLDLKSNRPFALSTNVMQNTDGTTRTNVAILYLDSFALYEWDTTPSIVRVYEFDAWILEYPGPLFALSQDFIFLQQGTLTMYELESRGLVFNQTLDSALLVHPTQGRLVGLSDTAAVLYSVSRGYLVLEAPTSVVSLPQTLTLTAIATTTSDTTTCTATITFTVQDREDFKLYPYGEQSSPIVLPDNMLQQSTLVPIRKLLSGPNQQFSLAPKTPTFLGDDATPVVIQNLQLQQLKSSRDWKFPNAADVVFAHTISSATDIDSFNQVIQTKDLAVTVWKCDIVEEFAPTTTCHVSGTLKTTSQLSALTFQSWMHFDQVLVAVQSAPSTIAIYVCDDGKCAQVQTVTTANVITSLLVMKDFMWVSSEGSVSVYSSFLPFDLKVTIDATWATASGLVGTWAPKQVYGNRYMNQMVWIDNVDSVVVASYFSQLNFLQQIPYALTNPFVYIAVGQSTFFIAEATATESKLREFNFADLANIKLQKDVYLYWYTFQLPLQAEISSYNGNLFIRALCTKCQKTFVLVLTPNTSQRDVLLQAINTGSLVADGKKMVFSPSGASTTFFYLNTGVAQSNWILRSTPTVVLTPNADSLGFQATVVLQGSNYDFEGFNTVPYTSTISVFNTQSDVTFNQDTFNKKTNAVLHATKTSGPATIPIDDSWFNGQVLNYRIECNDCKTSAIVVRNKVNSEMLPFSLEAATDFSGIPNSENFLAQTPTTLWFLRDMQLGAPFLNLDLPDGVTCKLVSSVDSGLYILSLCVDTLSVYHLHVTSCVAQDQCFPAGVVAPLVGATSVSKFAVVETTSSITLVVMNMDATAGSVHLYQLSTNGQVWSLVQTQVVDTASLKSATPVNAVDMTLVSTANGYVLLMVDAAVGVWSIPGQVVDGAFSFSLDKATPVDLKSTLSTNGQFVTLSTKFLAISNYKVTTTKDTLTLSVILTTSNVAHFAIDMVYDLTTSSISYKVLFNLNRYGNAASINKLRVSGAMIVVPYMSRKAGMVTLVNYAMYGVVFDILNRPKISDADRNAATPTVGYTAGSEISVTDEQLRYLPLSIQTNKTTGKQTLYTSSANAFNFYPEAAVVVSEPKKTANQDITVIAYNDQMGDSVQETSTMKLDDLSSESSWKWWYTLLIVLAVVLVIALAVWCWKKGGKKVGEGRESLLQVQRES